MIPPFSSAKDTALRTGWASWKVLESLLLLVARSSEVERSMLRCGALIRSLSLLSLVESVAVVDVDVACGNGLVMELDSSLDVDGSVRSNFGGSTLL